MASSNFITAPKGANTPISGRVGGYMTGAAQGAVAGAMVAGPVGAAVGAVAGAAIGFLGGAQADKAQYYKKMASRWQTTGKEREAAIMIRDQLRQFRMQRAVAMTMQGTEEGANRSSAPQGAVGSLGSQYAFNSAYVEGQVSIDRTAAKFMRKAGKSMAAANNTFAWLDTATSLAPYAAGGLSAWQSRSPSGGFGLNQGQLNTAYGQIGSLPGVPKG